MKTNLEIRKSGTECRREESRTPRLAVLPRPVEGRDADLRFVCATKRNLGATLRIFRHAGDIEGVLLKLDVREALELRTALSKPGLHASFRKARRPS